MPQLAILEEIKDLEMDEVSFVDDPANPGARVLLIKRGSRTTSKIQGVQFVIGFTDDGSSSVQSVVFDSSIWDEERAEAWLKAHDMKSAKLDKTKSTLRYRQRDPGEFVRFRTIKPGDEVEKALDSRRSWNTLQNCLYEAVREKFGKEESSSSYPARQPFVRDIWGDCLIVEMSDTCELWRVDFTIIDSDKLQVTLGEPVPVRMLYIDNVAIAPPLTVVPVNILQQMTALESRLSSFIEQR
jgi:hypothetical protein